MSSEILLDADGFVVLESYLRAVEIDRLINAFEELGEAPHHASGASLAVRAKRGVTFARRNLLSLPFVQEFSGSESVTSLINQISPGLIAVRAILFDKTGGANWTVPWHQDRSIAVAEQIETPGYGPWSKKAGVIHVQPPIEVLRQMITLRFSLDACDADNGPLRTIRRTHHYLMTAAEIEACVANDSDFECTTAAGGVVIMRPLILHASSPAKHVSRRRVLHIEFGPSTLPSGLRWARV